MYSFSLGHDNFIEIYKPATRLKCPGRCISGKNQAAADRYYHQLHLKPWAKSPEEAAWGRGSWVLANAMVVSISDSISYMVCDLPPGGRDQNNFSPFQGSFEATGAGAGSVV